MGVRAFTDRQYDYYKLTKSIGMDKHGEYLLPEGSIFYHDKNDDVRGSVGDGCLKLCWTPDGNCYGWICGDCMAFHASFKETDLFKLVQPCQYKAVKVDELKNTIKDLEHQLESVKEQLRKLME